MIRAIDRGVALRRSLPPASPPLLQVPFPQRTSDPHPIGGAQKLTLALGIANGFTSRVPFKHLHQLERIHALRPKMLELPDLGGEYARLVASRKAGASLESLLPETFALVKEATRRALGMEHFDVQLLGGMTLADGAIAELKTGEGKTICAALAAALFALDGEGCHVATTNAYLASRDAALLRPVYEALGLRAGVVLSQDQSRDDKRDAYAADITYGQAETFAFDWLEDQLVLEEKDQAMRKLAAVVVDEADDVLIDTAQMPLVLSGGREDAADFEAKQSAVLLADRIVRSLDPKKHLRVHYERDTKTATLTEAGVAFVEQRVARELPDSGPLWSEENAAIVAKIQNAVHAHFGLDLDREYVGGDRLLLVSAATGHPQPKSKWRFGLMDAVTAKEGRPLEPEANLVGQITYQNFFRMYGRLTGMTGTAIGAKEELRTIYGKKVVQIPTHLPCARVDEPDRFFPHPTLQLAAAIEDVLRSSARGQPVLVTTDSVESSKWVSARLSDPMALLDDIAQSSKPLQAKAKELGPRAFADFLEEHGVPAKFVFEHASIPHRLLNAETQEGEAEVIAAAGRKGAITVATQMAGRGVDIPLGEGVEAVGGLRIVGIGHQTNARKDEQVRGRAGRQGKPGSTRFYVSPADALFSFLPAREVRALAELTITDRITDVQGSLRRAWEKAVESAQERAESSGQEIRKYHTELDSVIQLQRKTIIDARRDVLREPDLMPYFREWILDAADRAMERMETSTYEPEFVRELLEVIDPSAVAPERGLERQAVHAAILQALDALESRLVKALAEDGGQVELARYLRAMTLDLFDYAWVRHQQQIEELKDAAALHSYRQADPRVVFTTEASKAFNVMIESTRRAVIQQYLAAARTYLSRQEELPMAKVARQLA
jgi:preprotein translocase subunit SecA